MTREEFVQQLKSGEVRFSFRKKNGEIRPAKGTLKMELIPIADHPEGEAGGDAAAAAPSPNQKYYDLEKNAWRGFIWENFIGLL
jgi:hypothetical protein